MGNQQCVCPPGMDDEMVGLTAKDVMQYGVISVDREESLQKAVC